MGDMLSEILRPERLTAVVDIGANPIDGSPPYAGLLQQRLCRVVGFEPQADALAKLNAAKTDLETYLPYVIGDGAPAVLHICSLPGMSGLLEPDPAILRHFPKFSEWGHVIQRQPVTTRRLDDVEEAPEIDFLKIDAQGSELSIFQNGRSKLTAAVAVQAEVSFLPIYKNQPAFGMIDQELRSRGFVPHCFADISCRMIKPLAHENPYAAINQVVEADVVYVRDFTKPELMTAEQFKHLAIVAHHCYRSYDLAANCLASLVSKQAIPPSAAAEYLGRLQPAPTPAAVN